MKTKVWFKSWEHGWVMQGDEFDLCVQGDSIDKCIGEFQHAVDMEHQLSKHYNKPPLMERGRPPSEALEGFTQSISITISG